jgi:hypothetical protein
VWGSRAAVGCKSDNDGNKDDGGDAAGDLCYDLSHVTYVFHLILILTQTTPAGGATLQVASV